MSCEDLESYNFVIRKGFDKTVRFRALNEDGSPVDLHGSIMQFNCSLDVFDQVAVITDSAAGEFDVTFEKSTTKGLEERRVKYEVFRLLGTNKTPLFIGSINLNPEVT